MCTVSSMTGQHGTGQSGESIRLSGLEERAVPMTGDYLTDDIGSGYDLVLAIATLSFVEQEMAG